MKDWQERALKTFVQAFFGVLVPETVVLIENGSVFAGWSKFWLLFSPVLCAALAAGISAAWNVIKEYLSVSKEEEEDDDKHTDD